MRILYHKGIVLLMLSLLWLIEKLYTYWMKNVISSRLCHGHKQPEKALQNQSIQKAILVGAIPDYFSHSRAVLKSGQFKGEVFCHSLRRKYQCAVLVSHFQRSPDQQGLLEAIQSSFPLEARLLPRLDEISCGFLLPSLENLQGWRFHQPCLLNRVPCHPRIPAKRFCSQCCRGQIQMPESYPKMLGKRSTWKNENSMQAYFSCQS